MADVADAPPRRANALLRDYYGALGTQGALSSPALNSPSTPRRAPATDLDSDGFDAEKYVKIMLNEKNLAGLLKRDNELITEMKQIDSDKKTLVYENYTKLIDASDTIRRMRTNVESIEAEMAKLSEQVQDITSLAADLHGTFTAKKTQVHKLKNAVNLLRRLHFLFALPKRLTQSLKDGSFSRAVQFYATTRGTLQRYRHIPMFDKVAVDSEAAIAQIRTNLLNKLKRKDLSYQQLLEYIKVLIGIGQNNASILNTFIEASYQLVSSAIRENVMWIPLIGRVLADGRQLVAVADPQKPPAPFVLSLSESEHAAALAQLDEFASRAFALWETSLGIECTDLATQVQAHLDLDQHIETVPDIAPMLKQLSRVSLGRRIAEDLEKRNNAIVQRVLASLSDSNSSADVLQESLAILFKDIAALVEKVGAQHLGNEVHDILPQLLTTLFAAPPPDATDQVRLLQIRLAQSVLDGCINSELATFPLTPNSDALMGHCAELAAQGATHLLHHFIMLKSSRLANLVSNHVHSVQWMTGSHPKAVSKSWIEVMTLVADLANLVAQYLPEPSRETSSIDSGSIRSMGRPRGHGHNRSSSSISSMSQISTSGGGVGGGPSTGSASSGIASHSHSHSFGGGGGSGLGSRASPSSTLTAAERAALMGGVNRLFTERVQYFTPVTDADRATVLTAVVRIVFKTWIEEVRCETLSKSGFQQVLVDAEFCRQKLRGLCKDRVATDLLDEVVTSAYRRCVEPVFLSRDAISVILSAIESIEDDDNSASDKPAS